MPSSTASLDSLSLFGSSVRYPHDTGGILTVTVDFDAYGDGANGSEGGEEGSSLRIGLRPSTDVPAPPPGLSLAHSTALTGNATDAPMRWACTPDEGHGDARAAPSSEAGRRRAC